MFYAVIHFRKHLNQGPFSNNDISVYIPDLQNHEEKKRAYAPCPHEEIVRARGKVITNQYDNRIDSGFRGWCLTR